MISKKRTRIIIREELHRALSESWFNRLLGREQEPSDADMEELDVEVEEEIPAAAAKPPKYSGRISWLEMDRNQYGQRGQAILDLSGLSVNGERMGDEFHKIYVNGVGDLLDPETMAHIIVGRIFSPAGDDSGLAERAAEKIRNLLDYHPERRVNQWQIATDITRAMRNGNLIINIEGGSSSRRR